MPDAAPDAVESFLGRLRTLLAARRTRKAARRNAALARVKTCWADLMFKTRNRGGPGAAHHAVFKKLQADDRVRRSLPEYSCIAGLHNPRKNRYQDLLPFDSNRVRLEDTTDDYVNASRIKFALHDQNFIASQTPLSSTVADFWLMVWQQELFHIVMLTNLVEQNKIVGHQYWPSAGNYFNMKVSPTDSLKVHLLHEELAPAFFLRVMKLEHYVDGNLKAARTLKQFHFTDWAPGGVPANPYAFWDLVKAVNEDVKIIKERSKLPVKPTIMVHCSGGCGRSGMYIVVDIAYRLLHKLMKDEDRLISTMEIDATVERVLTDLRRQRMGTIENEAQYVFVHRVLWDQLVGATLAKRRSSSLQNDSKTATEERDAGSASGASKTTKTTTRTVRKTVFRED